MYAEVEDQSKQHKRSIGSSVVVWLDGRFQDEISYQSIPISALQEAGQSVKTFSNTDAFVDFITDVEDEKVIAVISDEFCETILPFIHDLRWITSIYIFAQDVQVENHDWKTNFYKVKSLFSDATKMIDTLKREARIIEHNLEHICILECSAELDLDHLNPDFMYLQIFKELILETDYDAYAKHEFVEYCHSYCSDNPASLRIADEIRQDYDKRSPIWWYTRDTFLFRLTNRSLRDLNGMMIWNLRPFIRDLHQALEQTQISSPVSVTRVFRGQTISKEILERLKRNVSGLLSFNSFLSTTEVESVAKSFILGIDQNHASLAAVIFEIDIDTSMKTSSPFASIDHLSQMREAEILFSTHTVFRIGETKLFEDGIWHIQLKMTMDDDEQLRQLAEYIRHKLLGNLACNLGLEKAMAEEPQDFHSLKSIQNMLKFAFLMAHIGQQDNAHRIVLNNYVQLFGKDSIDVKNPLYSFENIINPLERITEKKSNSESRIQWVEDRLMHSPPSDKYELADLYRFAANNTNRSDRALEYRLSYFKLLQETERVTDDDVINHHITIGKIFLKENRFDDALVNYELALQKALELQLPISPLLGKCYNEIGLVYQKLEDFEKALEYYTKGLDINYRSLPPTHGQLLTGHISCSLSLMALGRYNEAIPHFEKVVKIISSYTGNESASEAIQQFTELFCRQRATLCDINISDLEELRNRLEKFGE